ncbi:MAG: helix-turn-helix domain-containing protein, partial [Rhizobiales bacterium]|nr:helix-turn-helix domain-containing protein [Hyphomicrobiales bacterium]
MLPGKGDITIAHKTINLAGELSTAEKAVAGCIIEHVNRKDGRCDPGIDRIAMLTGLHRRTVIRAVDRLDQLHFIEKERHGSRSLRNSYLPNWPLFREREADWRRRFNGDPTEAPRSNGDTAPVPRVPPDRCQTSPAASDSPVTQTSSGNLPKEPSADIVAQGAGHRSPADGGLKRLGGRRFTGRASTTPSSEAARTAAEKRWSSDLHNRYVGDADAYALIIDAIDTAMQEAATTAEMRKRGSGLPTIL